MCLAPVCFQRVPTSRIRRSAAHCRNFHVLAFAKGSSAATLEQEGMEHVTFFEHETASQEPPYVDAHGCEIGWYVSQVEMASADSRTLVPRDDPNLAGTAIKGNRTPCLE